MNCTRANDAAEHARGRLDRQRLREARDAFDQKMPLREQADENAFEHRVLPGDHAADLEQRLFETLPRIGGWDRGDGHEESSLIAGKVLKESSRS